MEPLPKPRPRGENRLMNTIEDYGLAVIIASPLRVSNHQVQAITIAAIEAKLWPRYRRERRPRGQ